MAQCADGFFAERNRMVGQGFVELWREANRRTPQAQLALVGGEADAELGEDGALELVGVAVVMLSQSHRGHRHSKHLIS